MNSLQREYITPLFLLLFWSSCTSCTPNHPSFSSWQLSKTVSEEKSLLSLSIPYIKGDETGELTNSVIYAIQSLPNITIEDRAPYTLSIALLDTKEQKIGFQKEPRKKNSITSSENRSKMAISISLIERDRQKEVWKTGYILGSIEYDHQNNTIYRKESANSLGQLTDVDAARQASSAPLYRDISKKIAVWVQQQREITPL